MVSTPKPWDRKRIFTKMDVTNIEKVDVSRENLKWLSLNPNVTFDLVTNEWDFAALSSL